MPDEAHDFHLSMEETRCLRRVALHDESVMALLRSQAPSPAQKASVRLSRVQAEQLRKALTTQLATDGFDEDYSPTEDGQMLEKLIDLFYVR